MREALKAYLASVKAFFGRIGIGIAILGVSIGIFLLIAKYRDLLIDILTASSKRVLDSAQKQDEKLAAQENLANSQANALVDEANKLNNEKPSIDDDWNKK